LFEVQPAAAARNEIVFVHSGRGNHYYLGNRNVISFFQQENDPFAPGRAFNGIGRFMLLRIENPSDEIYLRIAATRTLLPGRTVWKPEGIDENGRPNIESVHAVADVPIGAVGGGAFNLFVGPLRPREFEGAHYVAIDFAEPARQILDPRRGLKALYNRDVSLDYRRIIGWARDISAVSAADYAHLQRPRRIAQFPEDLSEAETLEFSGIYEDGWLSADSKFVLGSAPAGGCVRLRGFVPELRGSPLGNGKLELTVDGHAIELPAATGDFDWLVPLAYATTATHVDLHFTASTKLPGGDDRPISAKLQLLEVLGALPARTFDYSTPGAPRLAASGIDQDGWMMRGATIALPANASPEQLVLRIEFPDWGGKAPAKLRTQLISDGGAPVAAATEHALTPGEYATVRVRLPASATARTLRLDTTADFPLPAPDTRHRSCRVLQADLAPDA
jgi:hypothetical protein